MDNSSERHRADSPLRARHCRPSSSLSLGKHSAQVVHAVDSCSCHRPTIILSRHALVPIRCSTRHCLVCAQWRNRRPAFSSSAVIDPGLERNLMHRLCTHRGHSYPQASRTENVLEMLLRVRHECSQLTPQIICHTFGLSTVQCRFKQASTASHQDRAVRPCYASHSNRLQSGARSCGQPLDNLCISRPR